jgi:regulator of protease activity HflC (stomatin/prohibitin superfamily)
MKRIIITIMAVVTTMMMTGCMEQVPQGTVGKILGSEGFQPDVYPPSKVYVDTIFTSIPEKLILVETTTQKFKEPFKILLKDKLTLRAEVIFRCRIRTQDKKVLNSIFNDIKLKGNRVTTNEVYQVYGKMIVLNTARSVISKYTVDEVNTNYERITAELYREVKGKLKGLPIEISDVTIGNIQYPKIVTDSIEKAKARRMAIEEEKAKVQIALTRADGQEQVAKAQYRIKMLQAKQVRDYNKMISMGISPNLLKLKQIEVQNNMVDAIKENKNVVYMPFEMMNGSTNIRMVK